MYLYHKTNLKYRQSTDKSFSDLPRPTSVRESDKSLFNLVISILWEMLAVNGEGFDPISQLIAIYQLLSSKLIKIFKFFFRIEICGCWRAADSCFSINTCLKISIGLKIGVGGCSLVQKVVPT